MNFVFAHKNRTFYLCIYGFDIHIMVIVNMYIGYRFKTSRLMLTKNSESIQNSLNHVRNYTECYFQSDTGRYTHLV